jgi:DNA-binding CsgD family transcriptional regulator
MARHAQARPVLGGLTVSQVAAASPRFCDSHLERAGVAVPAVHFVDGQAFCKNCFNGRTCFNGPVSPHRAHRSLERIRRIRQSHPAPGTRAAHVVRVRLERIRGYKEKSNPQNGKNFSSRRIESNPRNGEPFSLREVEVAQLVAKGFRDKEISEQLGISTRTVKYFVGRAMAKSGTRDRIALLLWWLREERSGEWLELQSRAARIERDVQELKVAVASIGATSWPASRTS